MERLSYKEEIDLAIRLYWLLKTQEEKMAYMNILNHLVVERMTLWDPNLHREVKEIMPAQLKKMKYVGATDAQVNFGNCDDPRPILKEGETYLLLDRDVHSWHTKITLVEHPDKEFNSVCFEEVP